MQEIEGFCRDSGWMEFRDFMTGCALLHDHALYARALAAKDPDLDLPRFEQAAFLPVKGIGYGSLNVYRKVLLPGKGVAFEKIYASGKNELASCLFFYRDVMPRLDERLSPRLLDIREGRHLTAMYFEFLEGGQLRGRDLIVARLVGLSSTLSGLSIPESTAPPGARDFRNDLPHRKGRSHAIGLLGRDHEGWFADIEHSFRKLRRSPAHGDMHSGNMAASGEVFDWDRCGLYPVGFDLRHLSLEGGGDFFESASGLRDFVRERYLRQTRVLRTGLFLDCVVYLNFILYSFQLHHKGREPDDMWHSLYEDVRTSFAR